MDLEVPYTDSDIETDRNSLRTKIMIDMEMGIPNTDSNIETDRNILRIKDHRRRRGIPTS